MEENRRKSEGERKKRLLENALPLCVAGFFCILLFQLSGRGIPCLFRELTGLLCPGCGMTHAIVAIMHGKFSEAMQDNALSLTVLPLLSAYLVWRSHAYLKNGKEDFQAWELVFFLVMLIVVLVYGILRDITLYRAEVFKPSLLKRLFHIASQFLRRE